MSQNTDMFKTDGAANYMGVSKATCEAWRVRGGGPVFIKMGKAVRYRKSDLDEFLNESARTSTSQK